MNEEFKRLTFAANDYLLKEGERSDAAYLILTGKVEVRIGAFGENPRTLAILTKGDVVGEMSLLDQNPHMASAFAIEETTVSALSAREFDRRINDMDPLMRGILQLLVKRVRQMGEGIRGKKETMNWANWKRV